LVKRWWATFAAVSRRLLSPLAMLLIWELASRFGLVPERVLAAPSAVLHTFGKLLLSGELIGDLATSLRRVFVALLISIFIGTSLALTAGLSRLGELIIDAPIQILRALPFLALVPLFIIWFGIGEVTKGALIVVGTTFPIYLTLFSGIRSVDPKLIEAGRSLGLDRLGVIRHVILPGAMPSLLLSLRYALGIGWLTLAVVEQINATSGVGYLLNNARDFMRVDLIVVCLLVYSLLGLGSDLLVRVIEHFALAWRPSIVSKRR
jgi:sulfonate transport system permease protein